MKPFARSGDGGLWVILNDCFVGYIGTEGECGIVARNIDEFMNIISMYRGNVFDLFDINVLKSVDNFKKNIEEVYKNCKYNEVFELFVDKHNLEYNIDEVHKIIKLGIITKPFFVVKSTDDEWTDSYSIIGHDDGQESLEKFINE